MSDCREITSKSSRSVLGAEPSLCWVIWWMFALCGRFLFPDGFWQPTGWSVFHHTQVKNETCLGEKPAAWTVNIINVDRIWGQGFLRDQNRNRRQALNMKNTPAFRAKCAGRLWQGPDLCPFLKWSLSVKLINQSKRFSFLSQTQLLCLNWFLNLLQKQPDCIFTLSEFITLTSREGKKINVSLTLSGSNQPAPHARLPVLPSTSFSIYLCLRFHMSVFLC